jgi:DNA transposition AAA+ family ATPase
VAEVFPTASRTLPPRMLVAFQVTKQHRRFVEFADAVRRHRYIGVCYGAPGLGKTLSARTYACAEDWERWDNERYEKDTVLPDSLLASRTLLYTPEVHVTGRRMHLEIALRASALGSDIDRALDPTCHPSWNELNTNCSTELVIVDEADRLKTAGLEQLRDFFDRRDLGLILIGMPGFDRQLARYPQLYSRIGFAHQYKPLDADDLPVVLANYWHELGLLLDPGDANDVETVSAIIRITGGNFRLIERLMSQVARVMEINQLDTLDPDVIHAARQMLVVGTN